MHTFTTLHRVVTYRDATGNDHVQAYALPVFPTIEAAVAEYGEQHILKILNRAIAREAKEAARATLEYDVRHHHQDV